MEKTIKKLTNYQNTTKSIDDPEIKDELQSYDMMHNDKYYNLNEVKKVLDMQLKTERRKLGMNILEHAVKKTTNQI